MTDWLVADSLEPSRTSTPLDQLYAAAADGVLALPFCPECGLALELEQQVCGGCLHDGASWRAVEPVGTVHSATLVHRREPGLVVADHPYPVLDVEVSSGHRLIMTTLDPIASPPAIGAQVTIGFRRIGEVRVPAASIIDPIAQATNPEDHS